jgi:hypothetical protein
VTIALDGQRGVAEVETNQEIAGLDAIPFLHADGDDAAGHLGREVDERGLDAAIELHRVGIGLGRARGRQSQQGQSDPELRAV